MAASGGAPRAAKVAAVSSSEISAALRKAHACRIFEQPDFADTGAAVDRAHIDNRLVDHCQAGIRLTGLEQADRNRRFEIHELDVGRQPELEPARSPLLQ